MGSLSNYWELEILDELFGQSAIPAVATIYFALSTTDFGEAGSGGTEPSSGSYARKSMDNNKTTWGTAASGAITNAAAITFATATADWSSAANLGYWAIFDAAIAGNCLVYGSITTPKPVLNGDTATIAIGDCDITLT
jgi:hypothetical protein